MQLPGIIIELKAVKKASPEELKNLAKEAILQIEETHYDVPLLDAGIKNIIKYGVAFSGKNVEVVTVKTIPAPHSPQSPPGLPRERPAGCIGSFLF